MALRLYSASEVAALLGIDVDTLHRYARTGVVRGFKEGALWRFAEADVAAFIESRRDGEARRPGAPAVSLLPELLQRAASLRGARPGVIAVNGSLTWAEVDALSDRLARALSQRGLGAGDRVVVVLPNCVEFVIVCFAVWKVRGVLVADSTALRTESLLHVVRDAQPRAIILDRGVAERLEGGGASSGPPRLVLIKDHTFTRAGLGHGEVGSLDALLETEDGPVAGLDWPAAGPEDVVSITYTSGSTGLPKGVMNTHESWLAGARFTVEHAEVRASDAVLIPLPLYHGLAFRQILAYALAGGALLIAADIYMALRWLAEHRPTALVLVPAACNIMLDHFASTLQQADGHLRYVEIGSAATSPERLERVRQLLPTTAVHLPYGLTEARVGFLECGEDGRLNQLAAVSPGLRVQVIGADGRPVAPGESGEILLHGAGLMRGYWGQDGRSQEELRRTGFRTGDLGRINQHGRIELLGRMDDVLKVGGEKVVPHEVELVLNRHPAVAESAVVGRPDPSGLFETRLCAHVVLGADGGPVSVSDLLEHCRRHLEPHKLPAEIVFRTSLPKSSVGKVLRSEL